MNVISNNCIHWYYIIRYICSNIELGQNSTDKIEPRKKIQVVILMNKINTLSVGTLK